jgi:MinD-like ATPase involved in chromosome partitioning or flagellar assembly
MTGPTSIIVMNFSGNVGKTTVTSNILSPRMPSAEIISVESLNEGITDSDENMRRITAKNARRIFEAVAVAEEVLVDVGSSNAELLVAELERFQGAQELFDLWVVPTVFERKQFKDTAQTVIHLNKQMGIPKERIRVVMNRADSKNVREQFASLFAFHKENPCFVLSEAAYLPECEVYEIAKANGLVVHDIATSTRDYRQEMKETTAMAEKEKLARMLSVAMLAKSQEAAHERIWKALTGV